MKVLIKVTDNHLIAENNKRFAKIVASSYDSSPGDSNDNATSTRSKILDWIGNRFKKKPDDQNVTTNDQDISNSLMLQIGNVSTVFTPQHNLSHPGCGRTVKSFIVGGVKVDQFAQPWAASVMIKGLHHCGAVLINTYWAISAAHCFDTKTFEFSKTPYLSMGVGDVNRKYLDVYSIDKVIVHPQHNQFKYKESDIAMIKIRGPLKLNKAVRPVCLPRYPFEEPKEGKLIVSGWGFMMYESDTPSWHMRAVELTIISAETCAWYYQKIFLRIFRSQICTYDKGKDACQGDSGGPAIQFDEHGAATLAGIVSYGVNCAGVFTKISYFLNWIQKTMETN